MMDIVKKNLISIICGVVALASVGVAFTMLTSRAAKLQADLSGSEHTRKTLADLGSKPRQLPIVDPDKAEPEKLAKFPNPKVIEQGTEITTKVATESKAMLAEAVRMNQHVPLEPGSLPEPLSTAAYKFRDSYQKYFLAPPASPVLSQLAIAMQAGMPPTPDEMTLERDKMAKEITAKKLYTLTNGQPGNQTEVTAEIADRAKKLPDQMRAAIAEQHKVYINPLTFQPWQPLMGNAGAPDAENIYDAQLTLWLQQDVIAAVNDANKDAKNIKDAVVKNLIQVQIMQTAAAPGAALPGQILPAGGTGTPTIDPDGALTPDKTASPTGRVSNGMYDVFRVTIEADVDAARLTEFLRALGHDRFMTPLWTDIRSVDDAVELAAGHDYGKVPVLNVKMQCEVLYLRQWNRPLMPKKVRVKLGLPEVEEVKPAENAAPAGPAAAAQ